MNSRDRLIELIQSAAGGCARHLAEKIADYLIANGVIVPPCKVGDLVYVVRRKSKRNKGGYWNSICFTKNVMQMAIKDGTAYIDCKQATKTDFALVGKTVFLTREEAEKALERRKDIQ